MGPWEMWFDAHYEELLADYFTFLRFQTVSADPAYHLEFDKCVSWLTLYLKKIGLNVEVWGEQKNGETPFVPPAIFASYECEEKGRPTLLLYHHYDVQPPDPLELWTSGPFEPIIKEGNVYARGAQDNKGQCSYTLGALRAFFEMTKKLQINLKVFIEGEEEVGSKHTLSLLKKYKEKLKSDYVLIVDTGLVGPDIPSITLGMRGIFTAELTCRTADGDMHSGGFGGVAYNPCRILAKALGSLWDDKGRVAVEGFYQNVKEYSSEEKRCYQLELDAEQMKKEHGLRAFCPDPGYSIGESSSIRPTLEINGMIGGYTGEGFKTVLPAVASAKLSCRLVPYQDAADIFERLEKHLRSQIPPGVEFEIICTQMAPPFFTTHDSPLAKVVAKAYESVYAKPCERLLCGGSIPITVELVKATGASAVGMGMALYTDQIHAPNEHFGLDRFKQGFLVIGKILSLFNEREE